jgi:hypothetical protein
MGSVVREEMEASRLEKFAGEENEEFEGKSDGKEGRMESLERDEEGKKEEDERDEREGGEGFVSSRGATRKKRSRRW